MKTYAKVALFSCVLNGLLMAVKYALGEASGSLALKADAIHSLADVVSSFSIFAGILIADRKTSTFPHGLYKVENLVALLSSFFIFFAAYEIVDQAFFGENLGPLRNLPLVTGGIFAIVAVAYLFSRYELKVALESGSPSLVADAKHVFTDVLSSLVVLVAVLGSYFGYSLDRFVALIVAVLVVRMGFTILLDSLKVLLDATLDYETLNGIREVLESHPMVTRVVSLGGRNSGRYRFVEAEVRLDARLLRDAHDAVSHLEDEILDRWPEIDKILIHYEPEQKDVLHIAAPLETGTEPGPQARLSDHFGEAPMFALLEKKMPNGKADVQAFLPNPYCQLERQKGVKAAELLAENGVDEVRTRVDLDGKGAGYALEALGIDVLITEAVTVKELLSEISQEERSIAPLP
jgi:cation diffusion facilitator family transporter